MTPSRWCRLAQLVLAAAFGGIIAATFTQHDPPALLLSATDIGFAQDMAGHHQQAVTMTDMLAADVSPAVRAVAEQIRFTQLDEIGQLTGWLQLAGSPPSSVQPMAWMHGENGHHGADMTMDMPGLASADDLLRLQRTTGPTNEIVFLQLMTRHHQGGIDMAAFAARHTATEAVRRVAATMIDEQSQEIQVMATLLSQGNATPLPYP